MQQNISERAVRTRNALLSAGFELMSDRSIDAIPIDDLVAAAGVGKGSFFNHFGDREGFKAALAFQVREEFEAQIRTVSSEATDPLERLATGVAVVTNYALTHPTRMMASIRMSVGSTTVDFPLNQGLLKDITDCSSAGLIRVESVIDGVIHWLGVTVSLVMFVIENKLQRDEAANKLEQFLILGLRGLGANEDVSVTIAQRLAADLKTG